MMKKKELEEWINQLNNIVSRHEGEKYLTKHHLIDEIDAFISKFLDENNMSLERFI